MAPSQAALDMSPQQRNSTSAPSTPASGCENRVPIATPAAPAAITSSTPPASTTKSGSADRAAGLHHGGGGAGQQQAGGHYSRQAGQVAEGAGAAVAGKLAYRSAMAVPAGPPGGQLRGDQDGHAEDELPAPIRQQTFHHNGSVRLDE